uniref:PB1 domain-containing protein n=1 Tax=Seriola lalandi dorsalis TaxID=1841481 RepID=A0A3B4YDX4_SERLL
MAVKRPGKLRVILNPDDTRKLILPDGIPKTMEQLMNEVRNVCGLNGNFRLQYQDKDFGDALVNLTSTAELEDLATIKVIPIADDSSQEVILTFCDGFASTQSDDTELLSTPSSSASTRTQMWPREFLIPTFSYDTELQLEKGNAVYRSNMTRLTLRPKAMSDILEKVTEEIYKYKGYPQDSDFSDVAEALIKKHPCLSEPGSYNGCYGWKQRLKTKMGNYRTQLKRSGCAEFLANSLKSKAPEDALPAKKLKRPRRGEANHIPDIPTGETPDNLENERLSLLSEVKRRNNRTVIKDKMAKTFSLRRYEVVGKGTGVEELKERWPALFTMDEVSNFFKSMVIDQCWSVLNDTIHCQYLICTLAEQELERCTMAVFVIREEEDLLHPPRDIGIVIEGVRVLNELPSLAHGCAMLFGLIYALNLSYPSEFKHTFDALQKVFMEVEPKKMTRRVCSLNLKLKI